ncbi:hypothetical protein QFC24_006422 [Naganishia onofrii]|uniref:Uncharacterized protein n=1 Tax=Naganishia onofrii TaxID=1851511 RepID=A0ACC2X1X9_9TREE|nr:hypothetical protein QFC24_006422 [Naganishia onofrii]
MIPNWMTAALAVLAASPIMVHAAPARPNPENHLAKRAWPTVVNNCVNSGQVALTFDDGPYLYENDIAGALGGSKATFFLNGNNYDCIYNHVDEIRALSAAGHTLGSHGWSHKDMSQLLTRLESFPSHGTNAMTSSGEWNKPSSGFWAGYVPF